MARTLPRREGTEGGDPGEAHPALTPQPLLLEQRRHITHARPLQGLSRRVQRALRPVEMDQVLREVHGVRALQPPPRFEAAVQRRVPQLVAEALQPLLA